MRFIMWLLEVGEKHLAPEAKMERSIG
jgi:hypothetical protein